VESPNPPSDGSKAPAVVHEAKGEGWDDDKEVLQVLIVLLLDLSTQEGLKMTDKICENFAGNCSENQGMAKIPPPNQEGRGSRCKEKLQPGQRERRLEFYFEFLKKYL